MVAENLAMWNMKIFEQLLFVFSLYSQHLSTIAQCQQYLSGPILGAVVLHGYKRVQGTVMLKFLRQKKVAPAAEKSHWLIYNAEQK